MSAMTNNPNKFTELENDIKELNSLMELSFISHQYNDVDELLSAVKVFISKNTSVHDVSFFYCDLVNNSLHGLSANDAEVDITEVQDCLAAILDENQFYSSSDTGKTVLLEHFISSFNLTQKLPTMMKGFYKDNFFYALAIIQPSTTGVEYSSEELDFISRIFNFIEPILLKYIKKKKEDKEIKNLHTTLHKISVLYNIAQTVNFIDDLTRLLKVVLNKALETVEAQKASLMFYNYAENTLQVKFVFGLEDKNTEMDINNGLIETTKIRVGEGIAGTVFINKKSLICNLGQNDPRFFHSHGQSHTNSLLCVPLIAKGEAIGVINISNKKDGKLFTREDLEFMEALANQAAIAIDNAKLYELATRDGLTKLYIYRHFYTLLENEIRRAARYEHPLSLLMMDIDDFKKVNDTYGHLAGDQVLKDIANTIAQTVRKIDIPARYGGEEFVVILPETSCSDAHVIANRIKNNIENLCIPLHNGTNISPTISIGISEFPSTTDNEVTLIELADIALYQAKAAGKNTIFEYTPLGCRQVMPLVEV